MSANPEETPLTRLHRLSTIAALSFLLIVFGVFAGALNSHLLTVQVNGLKAYVFGDNYQQWWWRPARFEQTGVTRFDEGRSQGGVTFYVSAGTQSAQIVDMRGRVLHRWHLPYSEIDETKAQSDTVGEDQYAFWDAAHLFPNGDLLVIVNAGGKPSSLLKIDAHSKLIWRNDLPFHHSVSVAPDGRILTLTQRIRQTPLPTASFLNPPLLEDFVTLLDADGKELHSFSVLDAFLNSNYAPFLERAHEQDNGDSFHTNEAEFIPAGPANRVPFLAEGNLIVSLRETHTVAVIDPKTEKVTWATTGPWAFQHDPEVLPNGDILMFDNRGGIGDTPYSRALEIDPLTNGVVWSYSGETDRTLYSLIRSGVQRLANGNTQIVESDTGRIIEVAADGTVVWEFVNPDRISTATGTYVSAIGLEAVRYARQQLPFLSDVRVSRR